MLLAWPLQEKTYARHFGLIGQRLCMIKREFQMEFAKAFELQYSCIHRLETNKLRNVAKFFGHLLMTDALPWEVLSIIHLNQEETTSSSRIFIKILCLVRALRSGSCAVGRCGQGDRMLDLCGPGGFLGSVGFQELSENMGLKRLRDRFMDASYASAMVGLFPKDNPKNTRFAINFFTSIGLGALTYVQSLPCVAPPPPLPPCAYA